MLRLSTIENASLTLYRPTILNPVHGCCAVLVMDAIDLEREIDELEVYGNTEAQTGEENIALYQFQVNVQSSSL